MTSSTHKIGIVVTGASGSILALQALRLLQELKATLPDLSSHLIVTQGARRTCELELCKEQRQELENLADELYDDGDLAASFASGSNPLDSLLIVPCSIRTLSSIAYGQTDRLSVRAADVMLKERRRLVLAVRETPFHAGHLRSMEQVTQMGGIIAPPVPAFYLMPDSIDQMTRQSSARLLSLCGLDLGTLMDQWHSPEQSLEKH